MNVNSTDDLARAIECLLFASPEILSEARLAEILDTDRTSVERGIERLREMLADDGLQLVALAGGYQLATRPDYAEVVQRLLQPTPARLSAQALEVLAIIAYRQPITRPEIDDLRGINSQHAVSTLIEKGMVTTVGRKNAPGRPLLYGTTPHFLSTFGLKEIKELPSLDALREAASRKAPRILYGVSQTGDEALLGFQEESTVELNAEAEEMAPDVNNTAIDESAET
ncbi:MAG: SMC-Scp complex subunit ScpB [Candidatus Zipacnadales bacterium]